MTVEFHPVAEIFPLLEGAAFDELVADVREHGLREPIVLHPDGRILDGRNRYRACLEACVDPVFETWDGRDSAVSYVVSLNLHRRHLDESQRSMVAARIATLQHGGNRSKSPTGDLTQQQSANLLNVGKRSVERAGEVLDHGAPELVAFVERGEVSVSAAADVATLPVEEQVEIIARGEEEILRRAKEIRADRAEQRRSERLGRLAQVGLPIGKYRVIYADPPWSYGNTLPEDYGEVSKHYATMTIEDLCALPVSERAADDAVLFLWVTSPLLEEAFAVVTAWGFAYKASFVWDKVKHNYGHYNSVRHEFLLVCTRGSATPEIKRLHDSVIVHERTEKHSEKPAVFRSMIEDLYPTGPRLELFARARFDGWEAHGDEL